MVNIPLAPQIDSTLTFIEHFSGYDMDISLVRRGESPYVFKASNMHRNLIQREVKLLELAEGIEGISHLRHNYGVVGEYAAILKGYAPGKDLRELHTFIWETNLQKKLEQTVKDLHLLGFADLDVAKKNIVLSPDRNLATIIDLDCYNHFSEIDLETFEKYKKYDLERLEDCFC